MNRRTVGPKGQIVIPEEIRRALGIKPGMRVLFEVRDDEIVVKPDLKPSEFVEHYSRTYGKKLKKEVDLKRIIEEEVVERIGVS